MVAEGFFGGLPGEAADEDFGGVDLGCGEGGGGRGGVGGAVMEEVGGFRVVAVERHGGQWNENVCCVRNESSR